MSIARVLRLLLLASAIAIALLSGLGAEETPRQRLDAARVTLEDIDAALKADNPTDADLARLRAENDALALRLQAVIAGTRSRVFCAKDSYFVRRRSAIDLKNVCGRTYSWN